MPRHAHTVYAFLKIGTGSERETLAGGAGEVTSEVLMQHPLGRLTLLACLYRLWLCNFMTRTSQRRARPDALKMSTDWTPRGKADAAGLSCTSNVLSYLILTIIHRHIVVITAESSGVLFSGVCRRS